jgi:hypothetical protein
MMTLRSRRTTCEIGQLHDNDIYCIGRTTRVFKATVICAVLFMLCSDKESRDT